MATNPVMLVVSWLFEPKPSGQVSGQISGQTSGQTSGTRRLFHRSFQVSSHVRRFLGGADEPTRLAFAELLLRLDADPLTHSDAVLHPPEATRQGLRWATFGVAHRAYLTFDPAHDRLCIISCA